MLKKYCRAWQATDDALRMRIVCWIPKATNTHTHTVCNTYCFCTATMVARRRLNVMLYLHCLYCIGGGLDSSVGIATRYGPDGPGIVFRWGGEIFRTRPDRPWGLPSLLYGGYRVFRGGKATGAWCWPPTPIFSAVILNRVELLPLHAQRALVACKGGTFSSTVWELDTRSAFHRLHEKGTVFVCMYILMTLSVTCLYSV